ncbi:LysR family transcriptional regulator [Actibacterium mucosum KCTC 23349]|uniref:LysR family transcriptional regulator n=1 Tax=Actibacterium mucosum KCTC 23349 TaxID=1454373 RepID=A0A037ZL76_9RHOB|nr:LysR family transcriptional regulator [Actibacterium mucosum]KAJ56292.1 LysR family transcriptional regulator [Actibacterium mucosum KCTC 23349]
MDIEALRTVALVAQHGSFAAAARVLNVDPSSVSRLVASIESEVGLRLFQRTTRSLSVTEEGELYLRRVSPLVEELDRARDEATQLRKTPSGTLRMTASVAFAHECVVPFLADFHRRYPKISIDLIPTDANLDILANGIDLALRLASAPSGDVISTRIRTTRYRVCASPEYLKTAEKLDHPRDLANHDCLRFALPEFRSRWLFRKDTEASFEVPLHGWCVIANALSLRQAARDGLGPVMLADWLVDRDIAAGHLIELFPGYECTATEFDTGAWALYPSRSYMPQKIRVMIDYLRACWS